MHLFCAKCQVLLCSCFFSGFVPMGSCKLHKTLREFCDWKIKCFWVPGQGPAWCPEGLWGGAVPTLLLWLHFVWCFPVSGSALPHSCWGCVWLIPKPLSDLGPLGLPFRSPLMWHPLVGEGSPRAGPLISLRTQTLEASNSGVCMQVVFICEPSF